MRVESIRVRGFGPFKKEYAVDLSEMRGLVAVTGVNGAGKSTLLELALPGCLYRQTPTRGSLVDLAVARDACLDVTVVNGKRWQIRHLVDSVSGKSEALVVGEDGQPAIPDSKVKSFDAWGAAHWPASEVLLSTIFGAQGSGGFLAAKPAERKAILLRVLGVERLERLATDARERVKSAKAALETTAARTADELARGGDVEALALELEAARRHLAGTETHLVEAEAMLAAGDAEQHRIAAVVADNARRAQEQRALSVRLDAAQKALTDTETKLRNNRAVLADASTLRAAVASLAQREEQLKAAEAELAAAGAKHQAALDPWVDVSARIGKAEQRAERAKLRGRDAAAVEQAVLALPDLNDAVEAARDEVAKLTEQLAELQQTRLSGADERIVGLRATLTEVSAAEATDDPLGLGLLAQEALETDDDAVAVAHSLPARVSELQERLAAARDRYALAQRQSLDAEKLAARRAEVDGSYTERTEAEAEALALRDGHRKAAEEGEAYARAVDNARAQVEAHRAAIEQLKPAAARQRHLDAAETRIAELEPVAAEQGRAAAALEAELAELPALEQVPPAPDLAALRNGVREWREAAATGNRTLAATEERLERARASAARRAELAQLEQQQLAEVADWTRVAADLGKDGLQALEIDAAGPELTAITNELLHGCHGPRFTARVETQRASADGKRVLEGCDVMVLDTVQGREASGETFSGGERVILAEALALAITVLACRRSGLTDVSLVRDESGAALDPGNARVYVAMLRKAVEMIGARHCLLVSHMPEVQELCDHRIEVGA